MYTSDDKENISQSYVTCEICKQKPNNVREYAADNLLKKILPLNMDEPWWRSDNVCKAIDNFHTKMASTPNNMKAAITDLKQKLYLLETYLKYNHNLCDKIEYTGSSFEKLNICGENIIEFDIMLVVDRDKLLELENEVSGGYVKIKCANSMLDYPRDNEGCINAKAYREYFYGIVQKWVNIMKHPKTIKLIYHGVATQINVYTVKEILWYQVDLVPCFKLYERKCCINFCPKPLYFVPKPVEGKPYNWRLSHSLKEVRAANKLHSQAKKSVRVVKAIFKFRSNGLFKDKFTSFHIKTAAFHLVDTGWPDKRNMGHNIYTFLVFIKKCLQNRELIHRFDPTINLLADYNTNLCLQMVRAIDLWLMSMNNFLSRLL
nr:cyclic GMP-AMP synthase isoform X2 [Hydra vulgaris]